MAGKTLTFNVEVIDVRNATPDEIAHGHAHGPGGHSHHHEEKKSSCCSDPDCC